MRMVHAVLHRGVRVCYLAQPVSRGGRRMTQKGVIAMDVKRHKMLSPVLAVAALLLLVACGGGGSPPLGTVQGAVSFDILPTSNTDLLESWAGTPFVPGELVVGFKNEATFRAQSATISAAGMSTRYVRALSGATKSSGLYVNTELSDAELLQLAEELGERPDVAWAHPNYILEAMQSTVFPDDPIYHDPRDPLWHYDAIGLPYAWAVTTGDPNGTVVAVVDTGILYRQNSPQDSHPDFSNNVLPGYDFISDWQAAEDGDGRDGDPYDVLFDDGLHGTHVAGTIAAATNNGEGIPGIDWHARILPVRVLGRGGGTIVDIMEGTLWAAGFDITGVPKNNTPARVINMSLGGDGGCLPEMQAAFDAIADTGSIVVVAAGNENESTAQKFPASCNNLITVGAVDITGGRAQYSNYGPEVDIMAPGGDVSTYFNNGEFPDGVLSLGLEMGQQGWEIGYTFKDGTSMAAPHVAGVISLMLAVNPNLNVYSALDIITSTAFWPGQGAGCDVANGCGAGIIDAYEAVVAAQNYTGNPGPGPGPGPQPGPGAQAKGPMIIMAFQETAGGELVEVGSQTSAGILEQFSFQVDPGTIMLAAWADENEDGEINHGDYVGMHPWPVSIRADETKTGLDIKMAPYFEGMELAANDLSYAQLAAWLEADLEE